MLKRIIPLHASFLLVCLWTGPNAIASDNLNTPDAEKPIEIYSKTVEFEEKKGTATYKGSVVMEQGDRHLTSDVLIIHRNQNGKIEYMIATGNPAKFHTKTETIQGEHLTYFVDTHVLSSNPVSGKQTTVILAPSTSTTGISTP